ncbi:MBT domain-containing protein 1-like isoform X1 [Centruroides sculpturatus]|uniref:MBT domain-containing protein 1-like isoform X1 n=1 Tax=Centruroides sculpturatus TaxID=218467 RepID=UPI000C6D2100|nr:MBT domain-containing protein 1-like isoform X1 [Centruroides sculpturatus]XP_023240090.1 MBT domain-containing protein 1-like isoform X1 [Centruroides sculpturatus]XP_023240091.1 MBT domain-containing protein 1-like isoform X1 [Centruroides sculpturatus]XP_023240092.1 MBT domain-containing protein 1-like isoform X1 [Centruroides sculpturatus]
MSSINEISSTSESSSSSSESDSDNELCQQENSLSQNGLKRPLAIRKDGMAVCERCGNIGVKHAFYSKTKRYCSLACSRGLPKATGGKTSTQMKTTKRPISQSTLKKSSHLKKSKQDLAGSFDWKPFLDRPDFSAAPVSCFKHVSMSDCWDNITVGMKIEVENKDCNNFAHLFPSFYWIATVIKIAGYMAQLRYEGFGTDNSKDFWVNLCTENIHPVGWCASQGKPLIPPKSIEHKYNDWKEFLVKRLTGARTLPANFHIKVKEGLKSRFQQKMKLEVVDKNRISAVRVAKVIEVIGGRLHVAYETAEEDEGFWCHERSPLIHPIGWAQIVGHDLRATPEYAKKSLQKTLLKKFDSDDAVWDMFLPVKNLSELKFKEGMKLEAIDPLNLSTVCVATVTKVLRNNYLMIGIDGMMAANGSDWFCYHASSPCIFPVGFCELNNIELTPPRGHKGEFKWFEYLKNTKSVAAPVALFKKDIPNHGFKEGMYLEAVDLMEPRLICVGAVTKVVGRLLRIHFDGWDETYDQWCDCESPDLFPVGWCQYVGYRLEPPRNQIGVEFSVKRKKKHQIYKGPRKKKKGRLGFYKKGMVRTKVNPSAQENINTGPIKQESDDTVSSTSDIPVTCSSPSVGEKCGFQSVENNGNKFPFIMKMSDIKTSVCGPALSSTHSEVNPEQWDVLDVAQFLRINECGAYCQMFSQQKIDGKKFLSMTKEDIMSLTGMKVGPSLKIFDLIQQLRTQIGKHKPKS